MSATQITLQSVSCQNHPLIRAHLNELRNSQKAEVDENVYYHAQSLIGETSDDFSDTDDDVLYHAQSQISPEPNNPAVPAANIEEPHPLTQAMPCTSTYQGVSVTAPHRTEPEPTGAPHREMMSAEAEPEPTEAAQRKAMTRKAEPEPIELPHREVMTAEPVPTEAEPSILQGSDDSYFTDGEA